MSGGDEFEARLAKAAGMRARGDEPYPVRFDRTHTTGEVREHWADRLGDGDSTDDTDHDEGATDPHVWLSPDRMASMAAATASSKKFEAPISAEGPATQCCSPASRSSCIPCNPS